MKIKIKSLKRDRNELRLTIGNTYEVVYDEFEDYHFTIDDAGNEVGLEEIIKSYNAKVKG
ncbi:hypothetical protein vBYenM531-1_16 [Yersinia phage vB_YenM_531]|nr:hypothetical protein X1_41 [Yersinia phage vB_Yen_X1]QKN86995.1 hypothetical protein vBYenM531-1_16 [Yersinia phage vB_YenM_531]QKN87087.1 hypothetical protein vBYenM534_16 [Yersinia phage vB_YenM_534]QKN87451.1 hypothetical protein vBYenM281_016 [Yersinia phage vB_YenM_281]CAJ28414.1 hypothetical protein [Yersinia phage PY100]